jgi:hypothetical protein
MKKISSKPPVDLDRDTMRKEYDFSEAVRGITAIRYARGANVVVIDPEVLDVFPDSLAVNETLRALAPVLRRQRASKTHRKTHLTISSSGRRSDAAERLR